MGLDVRKYELGGECGAVSAEWEGQQVDAGTVKVSSGGKVQVGGVKIISD